LPALRAISYAGVTGQIAFDDQGNLKAPSFTVYKVVDGKWQPQTVLGGAKTK
jgi:branched-chain amino acid transport system substrate-binding protein